MTPKKILIVNGPNLNMVGRREQEVYGSVGMDQFLKSLEARYGKVFEYYQSNVEGEIINALQGAIGVYGGVILNAGGYTHTSVAIADAVKAVSVCGVGTIEVHISNIMAREEFRHVSLIAPVAIGSIMGFGLASYCLALDYFLNGFLNEKN